MYLALKSQCDHYIVAGLNSVEDVDKPLKYYIIFIILIIVSMVFDYFLPNVTGIQ